MKTSALPKINTADSIAILKTRFPGSLVCVNCARLIASTPAGYASSNLTPEQVDGYVCASCRSDVQIAAETTDRFRMLKPRTQLRPPLAVIAEGFGSDPDRPLSVDERTRSRRLLIESDAEATGLATSRSRRDAVPACPHCFGAHDLCAYDASEAAMVRAARTARKAGGARAPASPAFCAHGRSGSDCIFHGLDPTLNGLGRAFGPVPCNTAKSLDTVLTTAPPATHGQSRAGTSQKQRRELASLGGLAVLGAVRSFSRLAGRRLGVRRQRASPGQLAALARINAARGGAA